MKQYGKIVEGKDITNKTYVDEKDLDLDKRKLEETDFNELSNSRVLELWNQYIGEGSEESGSSGSTGSNNSNVLVGSTVPSDDIGNNENIYIQYTYTPATSVNLVDINKCVYGYRLSSEGSDFADNLHVISEYVEVEPNTSYDIITTVAATNSSAYISLAWYTSSKGFISRPNGALATYNKTINVSYTSPNNASWARLSFPIEIKDSFSFTKTVSTESMSVAFYVKYNDRWMKASYT